MKNNLTILIVEDDLYSSMLLKEFLKSDCITIHHVTNGEDAIAFCKENHIDLVLMDIRLPLMNGDLAMKEIKLNKPNLSVIAQTANAMTDEVSDLIKDGFDGYILKPYNRKDLLKQLNIL